MARFFQGFAFVLAPTGLSFVIRGVLRLWLFVVK